MANKVVILGSLNVDTILRIKRVPQPGETLQMNDRSSSAGGKGANQAVAAARAGAETSFIGQVGNDDAGKFMIESLKDDNVDTSGINVDTGSGTGSAYIFLDENGQNSILVYGGANQKVTETEVNNAAEQIKNADFVVTQFETPQKTAIAAFKLAKESGAITILNPAPASEMLPELLELSDIVVPNETESASLTGIEVTDEASMVENATAFAKLGVKNLIITVGSKGVFYSTEDGQHDFVPAFKVDAVDTTAAGDTFIGALSSQLKKDLSNIKEALTFAQRASSITVQRLGAMPSIPTKAEIEAASK